MGDFETLKRLVSAHRVPCDGVLPTWWVGGGRWARVPIIGAALPTHQAGSKPAWQVDELRLTHPPGGQHPAAGYCPSTQWAKTNYPTVINQLPERAPFKPQCVWVHFISFHLSLDLQSRRAVDQKKTDGDEGSAPHFPEIQEKYKNYTGKGKLLMRKNHHHILCLQLLLK